MMVQNLTQLADFLRSLPPEGIVPDGYDGRVGFDMSCEYPQRSLRSAPADVDCGSACCIGGWIGLLRPTLMVRPLAARVVALQPGLLDDEAWKLCYPEYEMAYSATNKQAARAVEILRDSGKCDWARAMEEAE